MPRTKKLSRTEQFMRAAEVREAILRALKRKKSGLTAQEVEARVAEVIERTRGGPQLVSGQLHLMVKGSQIAYQRAGKGYLYFHPDHVPPTAEPPKEEVGIKLDGKLPGTQVLNIRKPVRLKVGNLLIDIRVDN